MQSTTFPGERLSSAQDLMCLFQNFHSVCSLLILEFTKHLFQNPPYEAVTKAELNITNLGEEIDMNYIKRIKQNSVSLVLFPTCKLHKF